MSLWNRAALVGFFCLLASSAIAAPPNAVASKIQRIDIPDDQIAAWPREIKNLVAISRAEFEELLRNSELDPRSRAAHLTSAEYSATFAGGALRDGRARLTVQRTGDLPVLMPLNFNLAVRDLKWSNRAAVWGSDDAGDSWLLADLPQDELHVTWTAGGRSLADDLDFDLSFPAAESASFDIRVQRDRIVRSTPEARRVDEGSDAAWQVWRIQLGSERRCRLAVSSAKDLQDHRPAILFEHELAAIVREEDLRFQTVFQVEVFDAPVSELTFNVPSSVDIFAVTYGQDLPLTWTRPNKAESAGTLTVKLPGALLGRSRPIRIDGVALQKPNTAMISPQISVKDGIFIGGRQTLTIVAPLVLRSFRPTGFRQQTPLSESADGESYTFQQLLPDAQLVLDVGRPLAALAAQVYSVFETGDSSWTLNSELRWTASSGGVFQTECMFPADWEITDVRLAPGQGNARLAGVDVSVQSGGSSLLTAEFLEALEPGVARTLRVLARKRPPASGGSFALPVPYPINCHSVETTLGLILPSTLSPLISDDARVERFIPPDETILTRLRGRRPTTGQNEYWYRRDSIDQSGSLQLVSRLRRVTAASNTSIVASPTEYTEHYQIRCQAEAAPVDRLLVYLTERGPDIRWSIPDSKQGELTAQRLPENQHSDWNCPPTGELWELRMPTLPAGRLEIEGRRNNRWSSVSRPALLIVPQAIDRRAVVTLTRPASLDLRVEAIAMERQPKKQADPNSESSTPDGAGEKEESTVWEYEKPDAGLRLAVENPERSREFPTMVSMRLRSLLSANPQGYDLYRAEIRLENGSARDELRIRMNPDAVVQQVTIAGQATVPNFQGNELLITDLNAADHDLVELLYRTPSQGGSVRDVHRIIVPEISARVLAFRWDFALPPSMIIHAEPNGVRLTSPLQVPTWTERLFGPLGRPRDEQFFNPFRKESWQALVEPSVSHPATLGGFDQDLITPAEWQVYTAVSAVAPSEIQLVTWQSGQTRLLAWISLTVSLIIGVILRIIGWKYRDKVAAYWLALLVSASFCAPSPYAETAGGAIAGTVIALLTPRRSLIRPTNDGSHMIPLGSTHSFDWGAPAAALLAAIWVGAASFADETTLQQPTHPNNVNTTTSAARSARIPVYVPVDSRGRPSSDLPLVYLPQNLLTSLRDAARSKSPPQSLIASAIYRVTANSNGSDSVNARFRVHVLDTSADRRIVLPISDAFLTGENACLLDGKPHPIQAAPDGKGLIVTWSLQTDWIPDALSPNGSTTASFDIELDLKRVGLRTSRGGRFTADVPVAASSKWSLSLPEAAAQLDVTGARGAVTASADQRSFEIDFGSAHHMEARWSQTTPEYRRRRLELSQLQFLDLRATNSELRFRIRCEPLDEPDTSSGMLNTIDYIDLDLPARCLVRDGDIRATNLLRTESIVDARGKRVLRVLFSEPQRQKFNIDGVLLIPNQESATYVPLPAFSLVSDNRVECRTVQNWWCVNTSPEFRLEHQNLDADLLGLLTSTEFLQAWGESPPTGSHQLVFQQREGMSPLFTIVPQFPRRRATSWVQTGSVGKRRLEWTLSARIETTQAPAYQHVLLVDRRLQIESVSVMVNGAERLLRMSETRQGTSPTRVVLFLRDKTIGLQSLTLKGSMPTRYGRNSALPYVRCEEIEQVDSRWELFRDPEVDVDLTLPRGVTPFDAPEEAVTEEGRQLVAWYKTTDPDPKTSIRVSARQARCAARTAVVLTRTKDAPWKLLGQLRLEPRGESPRRMGVNVPANALDSSKIRVDGADAIWHEPADGWRRLDLTLLPEAQEVTMTFETTVDEPTRGDWELPLPEPQEAVAHQIELTMSPADAWTPLAGTELKPDEKSDWAVEFLGDRKIPVPLAEYRLDATPVRMRRNQSATHTDQPLVRLLDHTVWLTADGRRHGFARAFLSQTRDALHFQVPRDFQLVSLFLDDRPLAMPKTIDGQLRIPLVGVARESMLMMTWEEREPQLPGVARIQNESLPTPLGIDVEQTILSLVPDREDVATLRDGQKKLEWIEAALDRMEMLLARQESLGNDPRAAAGNLSLIDELQAKIIDRLAKATGKPGQYSTTLLDRWNRIVATLNRQDPSPEVVPATGRDRAQVEEPYVDLPAAQRVAISRTDHSASFWLLDRRWIDAVCAVAISLIAIPSFRRLIRLEWGQWLNTHTTIAWMLLGLIWWLLLTPGIFGPVIITIAIWRAIVMHRQARNSVMVVE